MYAVYASVSGSTDKAAHNFVNSCTAVDEFIARTVR